jgi:predicted transcriptional regulator
MPGIDAYFMSVLQFKYRGRFNIVLDILDQVKRDPKGKTGTEIKEEARLSYKQLQKYLDLLLLCDFLVGKKSRYGNRDITRYYLTQQGQEVAKQIQAMYFTWSLLKSSSV